VVVERKARFFAQVMRGRLDVREIEDIGDAALSYSEVKALATGNPLLMDKAEADAELTQHHPTHHGQPQEPVQAARRDFPESNPLAAPAADGPPAPKPPSRPAQAPRPGL
jgi:hypothetical protein